ncbi:ABC transporter substrate-binding protein [Anaerolineales bacterium HSG24]|nr:ABC transporter substrate-binding protein [Anaerolineales bacterium HSG24]
MLISILQNYYNISILKNYFLLATCFLLMGCLPSSPPNPTPTPEPTPTLPPLARAVDVQESAVKVLLAIEPPSFNAYLNDSGYEALIGELVYSALAEMGHDGKYYPELAEALPTLSNGGLSPDGKTVVWQLRKDVKWSDGTPFTSADVMFTREILNQSGIWTPGIDLIKEMVAPDEHTVIITYKQFYPNYLIQFGGLGTGIFPKHYCEDDHETMLLWEQCNFNPISTGPFILGEWVPGERLTFLPNPHYFVSDRPLASQLVLEIVSNPKLRQRMLERGDAQLDLWPYEKQIIRRMERSKSGNVYLYATVPARYLLRLVPNLSEPGHPDKPHPILGDKRVRQAILQSIDVERLNRRAFDGKGIPMQTELNQIGCFLTPYYYDPGIAQALLNQAGWVLQPGDEVRSCQGCGTAEDGTPLILKSYTYDEFGEPLHEAHELIGEMLARVYIKLDREVVEGGKLWGTWNDNGIELRGNFDLNLWDDGYYGIDPTIRMGDYFDPRSIPTRDNPIAGLNVGRYYNPTLIDIFDALYTPLPTNRRRTLLCELATIIHQDLPHIPLLALPDLYGINRSLQGVAPHIYDTVTWNAADWRVIRLPGE